MFTRDPQQMVQSQPPSQYDPQAMQAAMADRGPDDDTLAQAMTDPHHAADVPAVTDDMNPYWGPRGVPYGQPQGMSPQGSDAMGGMGGMGGNPGQSQDPLSSMPPDQMQEMLLARMQEEQGNSDQMQQQGQDKAMQDRMDMKKLNGF